MNIARRFIFSVYLSMACFLAIAPVFAQRQISYYEPDYTKEYAMYEAKYSILNAFSYKVFAEIPVNYLQFFSPFCKKQEIREVIKKSKMTNEIQQYNKDGYLEHVKFVANSGVTDYFKSSAFFYNEDKTVITVITTATDDTGRKTFYFNEKHQIDSIIVEQYESPTNCSGCSNKTYFKYDMQGNIVGVGYKHSGSGDSYYSYMPLIYEDMDNKRYIIDYFVYQFWWAPNIKPGKTLQQIGGELYKLYGESAKKMSVQKIYFGTREAALSISDTIGFYFIKADTSKEEYYTSDRSCGFYHFSKRANINYFRLFFMPHTLLNAGYGSKTKNNKFVTLQTGYFKSDKTKIKMKIEDSILIFKIK